MQTLKRITLLLILVACTLLFAACGDKEIADKTPTDLRYTPAHQEMVTDYEYKYNFLQGDWVLVPNVHTETVPDKYEVYYRITYVDGGTTEHWETVDKSEYDAAAAFLSEGGGK